MRAYISPYLNSCKWNILLNTFFIFLAYIKTLINFHEFYWEQTLIERRKNWRHTKCKQLIHCSYKICKIYFKFLIYHLSSFFIPNPDSLTFSLLLLLRKSVSNSTQLKAFERRAKVSNGIKANPRNAVKTQSVYIFHTQEIGRQTSKVNRNFATLLKSQQKALEDMCKSKHKFVGVVVWERVCVCVCVDWHYQQMLVGL